VASSTRSFVGRSGIRALAALSVAAGDDDAGEDTAPAARLAVSFSSADDNILI
jgi:hypothetical protein